MLYFCNSDINSLQVIDKDTEITEDDINTLEPFADPFFKEYDFDYPKWTWYDKYEMKQLLWLLIKSNY